MILLSGSGLSSWALQREPLTIKRKVPTSCFTNENPFYLARALNVVKFHILQVVKHGRGRAKFLTYITDLARNLTAGRSVGWL